jgi:hypothetical protein
VTASVASHFHGRPAKKMTNVPAARTKVAVPRSGWCRISTTGIAISSAAKAKSMVRIEVSRLWKYQASIIGSASRISSDGWIVITPRLSQRVAPFTVVPKNSTPSSSTTPHR